MQPMSQAVPSPTLTDAARSHVSIAGTIGRGQTLIVRHDENSELVAMLAESATVRTDEEFLRITAPRVAVRSVPGWVVDERDIERIADRVLIEAMADPSPAAAADPDAFAPLTRGGQGRSDAEVADAGRVLAMLGGVFVALLIVALLLIVMGELVVDWRVV